MQALRGSCSANAEFVMEDMVKRDNISGLLLVAGESIFAGKEKEERLKRKKQKQDDWSGLRTRISSGSTGGEVKGTTSMPTKEATMEWYMVNVALTPAAAQALTESTVGQASNLTWHEERQKRITASIAHTILRRRGTTDPSRLVQSLVSPQPLHTAAIEYGKCNEGLAIEEYLEGRAGNEKTAPKYTPAGLVVNADEPWFGASPDGVLPDEEGIIEVKCPYVCKDKSFEEEALEKTNFCLEKKEGRLLLRRNHQYFSLVQMQLYATLAKFCNFVVWSPSELYVERVLPDNDFISSSLDLLRDFYFDQMLPALVKHA